ncbi:MAG: phosphate ABC transporter, permease protein PstA [Gammaproteobacteria bacterium]|nr:phosphate ABC transporter, permease protein PstA [Gammaproteobacteria bacterium]
MTAFTPSQKTASRSLHYKPQAPRNITNRLLTILASIFAFCCVAPLLLVLGYVVIKGFENLSITLFTLLPEPPPSDGGGIRNAIFGTFTVTLIAMAIAVPVGVGGGIYLAEYSRGGGFSKFIRFGTNVLSGVPSIIAGVFIYSTVVYTKIIFGSNYSAVAGGMALAILMVPTGIKTTDEGLKLVPDDLRRASMGVGASRFVMITRVTLPSALTPIATGVVLAVARAAGETAPLLFTAMFTYFEWDGIFNPIASMSVLIYNFSLMPSNPHNELAWAASFVLVVLILGLNLLSRWLARFASR